MKSRIAILGMLVTGVLFSTAGAGLAISGGQTNNAAVSEYATATPTPTFVCPPTTNDNATGQVSRAETSAGEDCGEGGVLPASAENAPVSPSSESGGGVAPAESAETQPERQQAAAAQSTSQLPFTGFAAIPVLLGGLALLTGGLILRRRTREH